MLVGLFTLHVIAKLPGSLHHCSDIMVELEDARPNAKRARTGDTSVDVHGAEASASAEQQTNDAAGPSQQQHASRTFGASLPHMLVFVACIFVACIKELADLAVLTRGGNARPCWS